MTTQTHLKLQDPRYKRPTMAVETAKGILDLTEDEIVALVDEGALVAWDIRGPAAERRELRILTASVSEYSAACRAEATPHAALRTPHSTTIRPQAAIAQVLPKHEKPFLTGPEIKRALNCGRQHLINLVDASVLPQMPGTKYRQGPGGWPVIPRAQFIAFLSSRVIGGL